MIETVYIEEKIRDHPHVSAILSRFSNARVIYCERYGEVFNPKAQNFRLQKQQPSLILAEKYKNRVLATPDHYGIGGKKNYYFSHMLNCLYDCRYCFLQGMYQSAHYVLFVNYEDFQADIHRICSTSPHEPVWFFSGYDCDSLAMEPMTHFAEEFITFFDTIPNAWLELRTKSTQIRSLQNRTVSPRTVVAFSLSPHEIANKIEAKAPTLERRLGAIKKLQDQGWLIGLRFDPVVYSDNFQSIYSTFFAKVFSIIRLEQLHSVSLGVFRLPESYFKKIHMLYPQEKLFATAYEANKGMIGYPKRLENDLLSQCAAYILEHIPHSKFFPCTSPSEQF
jgi:spore photoproduct lyase